MADETAIVTLPVLAVQLYLPECEPVEYDGDACVNLITAMLRQAVVESHWKGYDKAARLFLAGGDCATWCSLIGLSIERVRLENAHFRENRTTVRYTDSSDILNEFD